MNDEQLNDVESKQGKTNVPGPRIVPSNFDPRTCRTDTERQVFAALQQGLSSWWTIFPNHVEFAGKKVATNAKGTLIQYPDQEREADFLLFNPKVGILVLEVKGGSLELREGKWIQGHGEDAHPVSPFKQAEDVMHMVKRHLHANLRDTGAMKFAFAACFPDMHNKQFRGFDKPEREILLLSDDLEDIQREVVRIVKKRGESFGKGEGIPTQEQVIEALAPTFIPAAMPIGFQIKEERRKIKSLTEQQFYVLRAMRENPRVRVRGCAGSGKTILALQEAFMTAAEHPNERVAVFCYNSQLAKFIRRQVEVRQVKNILVRPFLEYCAERLGFGGNRLKDAIRANGGPKEFWECVLPDLWKKAIEDDDPTERFVSIVVDEAQDFSPDMWNMLRPLMDKAERFYYFYDPRQNVYKRDLRGMPNYPMLTLTQNCRNTKAICAAVKEYMPAADKMEPHPDAPEGEEPSITYVKDALAMECELRAILQTLRKEDVSLHDDVIVIGSHKLRNMPLSNGFQMEAWKLVEDIDDERKTIPYITNYKVKGLDRAVAILLVDDNDDHWKVRENLYTARSRACNRLYEIHYPGLPGAADRD